MKLLRASCGCGFVTRKARSGYHHDKWWFPLFSTDTGTLTDVPVSLPTEDRNRIDQQQFALYHETPRDDKHARREASAKMKAFDDEIHKSFIKRETITLRNQYALDAEGVFDPPLQSTYCCPDCGNDSLVLDQVHVIAICKADCGYEYEWPDSETAGCPRCGYRPHRFQTEHEPRFADRPRTTCWCPCSSSTDTASHVDGYCPKCGELPDGYQVDGFEFCGIHDERLLPYELPANFLFIETESRWVAHQFPNAKLWGDASTNEENREGAYCPSCESDHQRWLRSHVKNDGEQSGEREPRMTPDLKS